MNEPVAWMLTLPDGTHDWILDGNGCEGYIPLYTHPVEEQDESFDRTASHMAGEYVSYQKELTDEEIWDWFKENTALTKESALMIARAILRKAQEK